jgi:asparagine synthase (glutamine-hydrolysing)
VKLAGYKVALSGLGGDEALGGYGYTRFSSLLRLLRLVDRIPGELALRVGALGVFRSPAQPGKLARLLAADGPRSLSGVVALQRELFAREDVSQLMGIGGDPDRESPAFDGGGTAEAVARAELVHYLQPMLLPDADAFSMASSVELRVPFVDVPFFAAALDRRKVRGKMTLVDQMNDRYLSLVSRRPKTGFAVPMKDWLAVGALREVVSEASEPNAPVWDHLDPAIGRPILAAAASAPRWAEAWALAALDGWLRRR